MPGSARTQLERDICTSNTLRISRLEQRVNGNAVGEISSLVPWRKLVNRIFVSPFNERPYFRWTATQRAFTSQRTYDLPEGNYSTLAGSLGNWTGQLLHLPGLPFGLSLELTVKPRCPTLKSCICLRENSAQVPSALPDLQCSYLA